MSAYIKGYEHMFRIGKCVIIDRKQQVIFGLGVIKIKLYMFCFGVFLFMIFHLHLHTKANWFRFNPHWNGTQLQINTVFQCGQRSIMSSFEATEEDFTCCTVCNSSWGYTKISPFGTIRFLLGAEYSISRNSHSGSKWISNLGATRHPLNLREFLHWLLCPESHFIPAPASFAG